MHVLGSEENCNNISILEKGIEEFLTDFLGDFDITAKEKVVHDGLWGTLRLKPWEVALIDTPLLQRLRQVHQMGCAQYTYPSATHTRFEHTLGVILQVQRLGEALQSQQSSLIDKNDITKIRLAALCHDIGHGPFSHTSELIYGGLPVISELKKSTAGAGSGHELLSYMLVRSKKFKGIFDLLAAEHEITIEPHEIADFIVGKKITDTAHQQLINGPFDADKLDYLFRDSHFSGLPLSIDIDRLWYSARIHQEAGDKKLIVNMSGATVLEQILFAKMMLFTTLYHHHKIRAFDCMFAGVIEYLKRTSIETKVRDRTLTWNSPLDYLWVTDSYFLDLGFRTTDQDLHKLIHAIYYRRPLKRALVISRKSVGDGISDSGNFSGLISNATPGALINPVLRGLANEIWEGAGKPCLPEEVWVDLPPLPSMKSADETYVGFRDKKDHKLVPLTEIFPTANWVNQYGINKWRGHVFCPEKCRDKVARSAKAILEKHFEITFNDYAFNLCKAPAPE